MKDLAQKIDSMRQFGYVLLTPKEAKRVAIELRRVERLKKKEQADLSLARHLGWCEGWDDAMRMGEEQFGDEE